MKNDLEEEFLKKMLKLEKEAEATQKLFESYGALIKEIIFSLLWMLWSVVTVLPAAQKSEPTPISPYCEKAICNVEKKLLGWSSDDAREYLAQ